MLIASRFQESFIVNLCSRFARAILHKKDSCFWIF